MAAPSRGVKRSSEQAFAKAARTPDDARGVLKRHRAGDMAKGRTTKVVGFGDEDVTEATAAKNGDYSNKGRSDGGGWYGKNKEAGLKDRARTLLQTRKQLPIWAHRGAIRAALRERNVLLLVGETGSGKSTQVPQFLVGEEWCRRRRVEVPSADRQGETEQVGVGGCIAITQPRRVAATALAKRVAEEMGTACGKGGEVGYSVRFDVRVGKGVRVKFLTEGMLLMEMLRDPSLREYSAVVVDEVHERGVGVDLCLGFLRGLVGGRGDGDMEGLKGRGGAPLKVVVMSATADMVGIERFFGGGAKERADSKDANGSASAEEEVFDGFSDDETSTVPPVTTLRIPGRLHPVQVNHLSTPTPDIVSAAFDRVVHIHTHTPLPGDVLVFLPGQETIESLLSLLTTYAATLDKTKKEDPKAPSLPNMLLLPLYAALPPHQQQLVFQQNPKFTRKIILSTNIAETSLTVPGVRHVVDSGLAKQRLFRPSLNIDSLLTTPISRSSATQRSGRAGRDAPGTVWRLYTEKDYYELKQDTEPEVVRCDLSQLVLTLKAHGVKDLRGFKMLTKPPKRGMERAFVGLLGIGALDGKVGAVTSVGREMSLLPLPGNLARVLLASEGYGCVDEMVDVVAALSVENVFMNIHEGRSQRGGGGDAEEDEDESSDPRLALRSRLHRREGDHITLLATVQAYVDENSDRKRWCGDRGISHRAMLGVMDVRKQLGGIMSRRQGEKRIQNGASNGTVDLNTRILKCLLTGLHSNVARLVAPAASGTSKANSKKSGEGAGAPPQYLSLGTNQPVNIHPSSVLFGRRVEAVVCSEFVFTTKSYARCVSAVEMGWIKEAQDVAVGS